MIQTLTQEHPSHQPTNTKVLRKTRKRHHETRKSATKKSRFTKRKVIIQDPSDSEYSELAGGSGSDIQNYNLDQHASDPNNSHRGARATSDQSQGGSPANESLPRTNSHGHPPGRAKSQSASGNGQPGPHGSDGRSHKTLNID